MIRLYQTQRAWGLPNYSQSSMKLETWLRMTGISYEIPPLDFGLAPKGKVPFIDDEGTMMGDSTFIVEHLKQRYKVNPDAGLSSSENAVALAFRRMIKENLFWSTVYSRYFDEKNWPTYRALVAEVLAADKPAEEQDRVLSSFREYMRTQLQGHGMGRHSPQEIYRLGQADLAAIADFLADKQFFMGETPTTVDTTVDAYVANILFAPIESPLKEYGLTRPNLVAYCNRMRARFYPEFSTSSHS